VTPTPLIAYIDADIIMYRAASFCDDEFDGDPVADWKQGLYFFDRILANWLSELKKSRFIIKDYFLVFTAGRNYRKDLYPEYKANRKDLKIWPGMGYLKSELLDLRGTVHEDGIEADDLIGIRCTEDPNTIAVSADKDFQTVPCRLFIPTSHGRTKPILITTSEPEADLYWMRQSLTGDTVDNYKGIYRFGAKSAEKLLPVPEELSVMWQKVLSTYQNHGHTEDEALVMARLARILRHGEYNFETKEIQLWTPPT
jgi:DNA polymerase-1